MHKKIITKAFEEASKELESQGEISPSTVKKAQLLSTYLTDDCKYTFGEKSLREFYNKSIKGIQISLKKEVASGLCKYLGYDSYEEYVLKNKKGKEERDKDKDIYIIPINDAKAQSKVNLKQISVKTKFFISISAVLIVAIITYSSINQQRWMVWQNTEYIEVEFDMEKFTIGEIKLYDKEMIKSFKKIIPDCNTEFFTAKGKVNLWYEKNNKKEYEYFTASEDHPVTGKTLKSITVYMIETHICTTY